MPRRKVFLPVVACAAFVATAALQPVRAADPTLIAAAQKEGHVTWYTTQIVNQFVAPAVAAFEKKYGIKVDYVRADPNVIVLRIWNEAKAGRVQADVFDGSPTLAGIRKVGLVEPWLPDEARRLPEEDHDPQGYWAATNLYVLTPAFNTNLVPKGSEPRAYADLLDPKWKGRIAWSSQLTVPAGAGFIGIVLASMGEDKGMDYLRRLAAQNITNVGVSAREVLDQVISGEYAIALQTFNNHSVISAAQGAPVAWIPMNPALAYFSVVGLIKGAAHENAAKLLIDFLMSKEGQVLYRDADYMPVDPDVPPRVADLRPDGKTFTSIKLTPEAIADQLDGWVKIYNDLFK
ncbi:MAG TPA: extracellular solute-binding protein [Beijerinckiaceae bacterium]|nr:extracellular solute-binding protein [Beijerinckiaceae bacterium]